ncbi:hypothetical protein [Acinetobacter sp. Marseille-Q1623]|uniref:hypothetical protein n=1 Tax=Acinetobacter sp. Marseille-Q1623 TaxID=2697501 RepID=UPI00157A7F50|nr:hypothetical protein [Acinetobacter sp. Marseille-Q1623]
MNELKLPPFVYYLLPFALVFSICFGTFYLLVHIKSENKQPVVDQTIEQILKGKPDIFLTLYNEALSIFPKFIHTPNNVNFSLSLGGPHGKNHTLKITIPQNELSIIEFEQIYIPKFKKNGWVEKKNVGIMIFIQEKNHTLSCIYRPNIKTANSWYIEFKSEKSVCL